MNRMITVQMDVPSEMLVSTFSALEHVSELPSYSLHTYSGELITDLDHLLGTSVLVSMDQGIVKREVSAIITEVDYALEDRDEIEGYRYCYSFQLSSWLWLASRKRDCRIFQDKSALDIIKEVLQKYPYSVEYRITEQYRTWKYCVQYEETDYHFISRLMELEGMFFWFEHRNNQQVLVIADSINSSTMIEGVPILTYTADDQHLPVDIGVTDWVEENSLFSNLYSVSDYFFERSNQTLEAVNRVDQPGNLNFESYNPIAGYFNSEDGQKYAKVAADSHAWQGHTIGLTTNNVSVVSGRKFALIGRPELVDNLWVVSSQLNCSQSEDTSQTSGTSVSFDVRIKVIPATVSFRKPASTHIPRARGPMTATVTGPSGEEIYTDEYGRVKVQFHWDREGKNDENSSCWLRVSSPWAGGGFGGVQIPRIGDEVIVGFIGGNIDRPMVMGRFYNADNMPTWSYPDFATQMGTVTRTKYGDASTANFMRLQDKPGDEMMGFQAQRNMVTKVNNNEDIAVVGTQTGEHVGTTELSVGGTDNNIFKDSSSETNDADQIREIKGSSNDTVTGPRTVKLKGDSKTTMDRGYVQTIAGGLTDYSFGAGRKRTVHNDYTRKSKGPFKRTVSGDETINIQDRHSETITGAPQTHSTQNMSIKTTSGNTTEVSKANSNLTANSRIAVQTPNNIDEKSPLIKEDIGQDYKIIQMKSGTSQNASQNGKVNVGLSAVNTGAALNALSSYTLGAALTADNQEAFDTKVDLSGVKLKVVGVKKDDTSSINPEINLYTIRNS